MSAHLEPRSTPSGAIPGDQPEVGHLRHGAHDHSPREMTMTNWTTLPPWRVVETDKGRLLTVQVVAYAHQPVPAHLFVSVTDEDTAAVLFSAHLLAHLVDDVAYCVTPAGEEVQRMAGVRYRNRMLPVVDVLEKVGRVEGLWHVGHRQPGRWRRQTCVALYLTPEGDEFLLGPRPLHTETEGAVTMEAPR